ncbi:barstar family protein [Methyloferula stellata]|uniref:barstar family protein n=1 Tax=Methyloferula stellata TaxID=876270 RepID=UPI0003A1C5AE|nr:barstar family protein [Methyloferula stellata]
MRVIELDATNWKTWEDFYVALLGALGAPEWHGDSVNALVDSMIWGGINEIDPPYKFVVRNLRQAPSDVAEAVEDAKAALARGRADFRTRKGRDIIVDFEIID